MADSVSRSSTAASVGASGASRTARTAAARAAGARRASEQVRESSGVVPVLFSASAEAHDDAVAVADQGAGWRSPFGDLRPASGE